MGEAITSTCCGSLKQMRWQFLTAVNHAVCTIPPSLLLCPQRSRDGAQIALDRYREHLLGARPDHTVEEVAVDAVKGIGRDGGGDRLDLVPRQRDHVRIAVHEGEE